MLLRPRWLVVLGLFLATGPAWSAQADKFSIQSVTEPAPKEIQEPIRTLLADEAIQLLDSKGGVLCEVWFRKDLPAKATPEQIKNGLTYRELEESVVVAAIRFDQPATDYRKQKVKPGVYVLRLGFQPMDGDHMGTAPFSDFCLLTPAALDGKPAIMDAKDLRELSGKAIGGSHPGVLLLYPNDKPEDTAKLVGKENDTWVLMIKRPATASGQKTAIGLGLTLVGHTTAE